MLVFPIRGDAQAGTTDDEAFTQTQYLSGKLQAAFQVLDYDPDDIWIKQAYLLGLLTNADLHFTDMAPALAYKILDALAQNVNAKQEVAMWGYYTKVDDVDALRLTVVDLRSKRYVEQTIDASEGNLYDKAVNWAAEAIDQMRSGKIGSTEQPTSDNHTPPPGGESPGDGGTTPPGPGTNLTPDEATKKAWALMTQAESLSLQKLWADAISSVLEAEALGVPDPALQYEIANALYQYYEQSGDAENALRWVVIAGERAPEDKKDLLRRQEERLRQLAPLGKDDWPTAHTDWTIATLEGWLTAHAADNETRRTLITKYMELQPAPNWQIALKHLDLLLERAPRVPSALLRQATCLLRLGRSKEAISTLTGWRDGWPSSFGQDGLLLLAEAEAAAGSPAEAVNDLVAAVAGVDVPLSLDEQRYLVLVNVIESVLEAHLSELATALSDTRKLLSDSEPGVGRPREDVRSALSDVSPQLGDIQKLLDSVLPLEGLAKWQEHMTRGIELMRQALAEAVYALDSGDSRACARAVQTWNLSTSELQAAVDARNDYAPTKEKPADTTPDRVIGL